MRAVSRLSGRIMSNKSPAVKTLDLSKSRKSMESPRQSLESPKINKGKGKAIPNNDHPHHHSTSPSSTSPHSTISQRSDKTRYTLSSMLDEAMNESLPEPSISSSVDTSFNRDSIIKSPAKAHYKPLGNIGRPRLVSDLTRTTLPTATLTYAQVNKPNKRVYSEGSYLIPKNSMDIIDNKGESSSKGWMNNPNSYGNLQFPDLDPTTGLPLGFEEDTNDMDDKSLYLQRTITDLLAASSSSSSSPKGKGKEKENGLISYLPNIPNIPNFAIPSLQLPSFPSIPSTNSSRRASTTLARTDSRRSISSTASLGKDGRDGKEPQDWSEWASGWWYGHKGKMDKMMSEDDQADTVEEEQENLRKKCKSYFCHYSIHSFSLLLLLVLFVLAIIWRLCD